MKRNKMLRADNHVFKRTIAEELAPNRPESLSIPKNQKANGKHSRGFTSRLSTSGFRKSSPFLLSFLAGFLFLAPPAEASEGFTQKQVEELKKIVRSYLVENPNVIEEAILALQEKKESEKQVSAQKGIQQNLETLYKNQTDPVLGNITGSKKMVAFLDPFCGHCRAFKKILMQAIDNNQDLKVIIKDFPILGNVAVLGTKAMLAAHQQGFYPQMQAMIYKAAPTLNTNEVITLAKTIEGLDIAKFTKDLEGDLVQKQLDKTYQLAQAIGIAATPSLIIGEKLIEGGVPLEALKKLLDETK